MSEEQQDSSQKTEEPSQKKLDDALKQGKAPFSREVNSFILLLCLAIFLSWVMPSLLRKATLDLSPYIHSAHLFEMHNEGDDMIFLSYEAVKKLALLALIPLGISFVAAFLGNFVQKGLIFSPQAIQPKLSKISPTQGLKRIFSMKSLVEFIKGVLKVIFIAIAAYMTIKPELQLLKILHTFTIVDIMKTLLKMATEIMVTICVIMGFLSGIDFFYQKYEHIKGLRMSKQELKDEYKQTEGNPEIKAKLKSIRQERAKQRMMSTVPQADVVITNPTHYAIALEYKPNKMQAPMVTAKGQDLVALKIKEIAKDHRIPVVENAPLARALFKNANIDEYIPYEHYKAVAEVIAYVMRLKKLSNK